MPLIPLSCPFCGANLTVDSSKDAAICEYCGKPYIVKDAIVQNYTTNVTNITADTVNVYSQKDFEIKAGVLTAYNGESPDVAVPSSVIEIGDKAFAGMRIQSVIIPDSVKEIGFEVFRGCTSLTRVTIANSVVAIGTGAFFGCNNLTDLSLPDSIASIGKGAFRDCTKLTNIVIPRSVVSIGALAFWNCTGLTSVTVLNPKAAIGNNAFANTPWGRTHGY